MFLASNRSDSGAENAMFKELATNVWGAQMLSGVGTKQVSASPQEFVCKRLIVEFVSTMLNSFFFFFCRRRCPTATEVGFWVGCAVWPVPCLPRTALWACECCWTPSPRPPHRVRSERARVEHTEDTILTGSKQYSLQLPTTPYNSPQLPTTPYNSFAIPLQLLCNSFATCSANLSTTDHSAIREFVADSFAKALSTFRPLQGPASLVAVVEGYR